VKTLIIGGTGLISTTTTHLLVERGDEVVLFNRGKSSYPTPAGVVTITGDRTNYSAFEAQMLDAGPFDVVIDMVGYKPGDGDSLVRAFRGRTGHLIFCSTVDVYQKPATHYPYIEGEPYGGLNDYSRNKVILEKTLKAAAQSGAFPLTILRPAYTYGEGRGPISSFSGNYYFDRLLKGKPIVVHGDGNSLWVCCHQGDVGRAFVAAAGNPVTFNQDYHLAGEEWLSWDQVNQQAAQAIGAPEPQLVHIPSDLLAKALHHTICAENFQFNNIFDNSKARRDLGFRYTLTWKEGVRRMMKWLDEHHQVANSDLDTREDQVIATWQRLGEAMTL
jgi:nucleoside-diphosphate-sugar epimerase